MIWVALSLELRDIFLLYVLSKQISCILWSFCASFSCNSMPFSGCSALHVLNPNFKKITIYYFKMLLCASHISQRSCLEEIFKLDSFLDFFYSRTKRIWIKKGLILSKKDLFYSISVFRTLSFGTRNTAKLHES